MEKKTKKSKGTAKTAGKYLLFGVIHTLIDYGIYTAISMTLFSGDLLWITSLISGVISIFIGYYLHSMFTWKDREVGKKQLVRFFIWTAVMNVAVRPLLTMFFGLFGFLYEFAFDICQSIGLDFSYEFVETTGNYVLMMIVVMTVNFLVYDRFVFGTKHGKKSDSEKTERDEEEEE